MDTVLYDDLATRLKSRKRCLDGRMRESKAMCMARAGTWNRLWFMCWGFLAIVAWLVTLIVLATRDKCSVPTMDIRSCCNETGLGKDIIVVGSILTQPCREEQCEAFVADGLSGKRGSDDAWNEGNADRSGVYVLQLSIRHNGRIDGKGHKSLQSSSREERRDHGDMIVDQIACVQVCRACQEAPPVNQTCGWRQTQCEGGRTGQLWVDTHNCVGLGGRSGGFDRIRPPVDVDDDAEGDEGDGDADADDVADSEGSGDRDSDRDRATDNSFCCDNWSRRHSCTGNRTEERLERHEEEEEHEGRRRAHGNALCTAKCGEWFDWDRTIWVLTQGSCARERRCHDSNGEDCKTGDSKKKNRDHGRNLLGDEEGDRHGKNKEGGGGKKNKGGSGGGDDGSKLKEDVFNYNDVLPANVHKENVHWISLPEDRDYSFLQGSVHLRTITAAVVITTRDGHRFYAPIGQGLNGPVLP